MLAYAYNFLHWQGNNPTPFERLLRRDRAVVAIALLILILIAWFYVGRLATSTDITGTRIVSTERVLDGSYCDANTRGKNRQRAFLVAHSRSWPYHCGLVADAANVRCRACANSRGAHAVPWLDRDLEPNPFFSATGATRIRSSTDETTIYSCSACRHRFLPLADSCG